MKLLEAVYLIAPLVIAGAVHAPVIKRNLIPALAYPVDLGRTFRGRRVLGANKTWRGVVLMSAVSLLVVLAQTQLYTLEPFRAISIVDYAQTSWVALGLALGLSYSLSELPNSFVKRWLGIPPGGVSRSRAAIQFVVDQGDSAVGGAIVLGLFVGFRWDVLALVFAVGFTLHAFMDQLFFLLAVKRRTTPTAGPPLEGSTT